MSLDPETKKLIERLLLRGDRMLAETCPVCGTPLFLIKEVGLRFCPKCKKYIITNDDEYRKALELGIKPEEMILTFKPEGLKRKPPEELERTKPPHGPRKSPMGYLHELLDVVVKLVKEGEYDDARKVAEIIRILCECFE